MPTDRDDILDYAHTVCEGLNEFLGEGDYEMVVSTITTDEADAERVTFTMVPSGEDGPERVTYSMPDVEYEVETAGETLTFAYQDSQHIHIVSDADDWSVFETGDHVGEVIACTFEAEE